MEQSLIQWYCDFCEDAYLNKKHDPWVKRREYGLFYADVMITNEGYKFSGGGYCWWRDYVGLTFFAQIRFRVCKYTGKHILEDAYAVRLTNTKMNHGRSVSPDSYLIL